MEKLLSNYSTRQGITQLTGSFYDNKLLIIIKGKDARSVYHTIIENGWVSQLSHTAYLGKELAKAELSIKLGVQIYPEQSHKEWVRSSRIAKPENTIHQFNISKSFLPLETIIKSSSLLGSHNILLYA